MLVRTIANLQALLLIDPYHPIDKLDNKIAIEYRLDESIQFASARYHIVRSYCYWLRTEENSITFKIHNVNVKFTTINIIKPKISM